MEIKIVSHPNSNPEGLAPEYGSDQYLEDVRQLVLKCKDLLKNCADKDCTAAIEHLNMALESLGFSTENVLDNPDKKNEVGKDNANSPEAESSDLKDMESSKGSFMDKFKK